MSELNNETRDEQMAAAWAAGARILSDSQWHSWDSTIAAMADASSLLPRDCAPILTGACHAGYLIRQSVAGDRCIRATRKGQVAREELRSVVFAGALA